MTLLRTKRARRTEEIIAGVPTSIRVADLSTSPELQVRTALNNGAVKRLVDAYASGSALIPPIEVGLVEGKIYVLDGHHRLTALRQLRRRTLDAFVTPMSWVEAKGRAAMANLNHGLNLKPSERRLALRRVVSAYLAEKRHLVGKWGACKSFRDIEADLGGVLSYSTIRRIIFKHHPRLAAKYWSAEKPAGGGLRDVDRTGIALDLINQAIAEAEGYMKGLRSPRIRGEAIAAFEQALGRVKEAAPFELPDDNLSDF